MLVMLFKPKLHQKLGSLVRHDFDIMACVYCTFSQLCSWTL